MPDREALGLASARTIRLVTRPRWFVTRFTRGHAAAVRMSRGRLRRSRVLAGGQPILSLTTVGRRTGQKRSTALAYLRDGDAYAVFAVNLGNERDPAWCSNLDANPRARIGVDGRQREVSARRAEGDERRRLWTAYVERLPAADAFRAVAGREIPVFVLTPI